MNLKEIAAALESGTLSQAAAAELVRKAAANQGGRPAKTATHAEIYAWFVAATDRFGFKKTHAQNKLVDRYDLSDTRVVRRIIKGAQKNGRLMMIAPACDAPDNLLCIVADGLRTTLQTGITGFPRCVLRPPARLRLGHDFFFFIFKPEDFR